MARGWESKSVELQQQDAHSDLTSRPALTRKQRELESRKQGLQLSRSRILEQLRSPADNPRYRQMLERALADLDEQLNRLG